MSGRKGQIKQFWLESGCVYGYRKERYWHSAFIGADNPYAVIFPQSYREYVVNWLVRPIR